MTDDAERRTRYSFLFSALQYECANVDSLRDALQAIRRARPNVIFIDLVDVARAVEASRELRAECGGVVPVLLAHTPGIMSAAQCAAEAGADAYLSHPIDEVDLIFRLRTMMAHAREVQHLVDRNARLDMLLRRHVGGPLVEEWLNSGDAGAHVVAREAHVTVLFADVNGFTRYSSEWEPERTVTVLNHILGLCTLSLVEHDGTIDKYIGDCVMAYFGPDESGRHATMAVRAAVAMRQAIERWAARASEAPPDVSISIGINTGRVVIGNIGSSLRLDHTVIGDCVNVAARLQDAAAPGQILAGPGTVQATGDKFAWENHGEISLRGRPEPVTIQELIVPQLER